MAENTYKTELIVRQKHIYLISTACYTITHINTNRKVCIDLVALMLITWTVTLLKTYFSNIYTFDNSSFSHSSSISSLSLSSNDLVAFTFRSTHVLEAE